MNERRIQWLLVFMLLGQLALITAQIPDPRGRGTYLEGTLLRLLAPLAHLVKTTLDTTHRIEDALRSRHQLQAENAELRQEVMRLRQEQARLYGIDLELNRLGQALDYARPRGGGVQVADVVYIDHVSWLRTLILHVGSSEVDLNDPVTTHDGLVGRIVLKAGPYARAQLITDRASSTGAMIERTRRQGIVRGAGDGALALDYVALQADVRLGDRVVTAGIDGVYPRGIPIGTVTQVERGSELFYRIRVAPAVDFGLMDQVYLLMGISFPREIQEGLSNASP